MFKVIDISQKDLNSLNKIRKKKKIVLCHGAFDLIHPGHIKHFEESKTFGDILIVTITADKFIKKSIHNPYFDQETRINYLKYLKIIDYCFIVNELTAVSALEILRPNFYCKGIEYKERNNDKNLNKEIKALNKYGGKIKYIGTEIKSSSEIISRNFFKIKDQTLKNKIASLKNIDLEKVIQKMNNLKVLVIGEVILDEYSEVAMKGISPKSGTISCIKKKSNIMPGGSLATFNFVSSISKNSKLLSILNKDLFIKNKKLFKSSKDIILSKNFSKITKTRLVEDTGNQAVVKKIFTINDFEENILNKNDENKLIKKINNYGKTSDLIIVQDFGHGLFSKKIIKSIEKFKNKLSINVQTNSLNYGFNIIGNNFKKCRIFSLDERELQLFSGSKNIDYFLELNKLKKKLHSDFAFLTLGSKYSIGIDNKGKKIKIPKLNIKAVDTMGAGDIFHAMASVLSSASNNTFLILFLSQIAGAHAVSIFGNSDYPKLSEIFRTFNFYKNSTNF